MACFWEGISLGVPRAGFTLVEGGGRTQGSWRMCCPTGGWAGSCHGRLWCYSGPWADVCPLMGEAGSKARACSRVGESRSQSVLRLVPAHWWTELSPGGLWLQGFGGPGSSTYALVYRTGSWALCGQGHVQRQLWVQRVLRPPACWCVWLFLPG